MTFKKGFDPNRNLSGRGRVGMSLPERIREALEKPIKEDGSNSLDAIIKIAISHAKKGSAVWAFGLWDRAYGKVPDKVEMSNEEKPDLSLLTDEEVKTLTELLTKAKPK